MSEIRDKLWFAEHGHKLEADTLRMMVSDLLAELECVEIAEAMHVDEYGNGQCGEIVDLIKTHFKLQEAQK